MSPDTTAPATPSTPAPSPATAQRPDYVPESHWDAAGGKVKDTFAAHINELTAFRAAADSRRLSLPESPDKYEIKLPADFKAPDGVQFQFRADDPLLAQARTLFHEIDQGKVSGQDAFSKALGLFAGAQVASQQQVTNARNAEVAKLGTTGPARIDALTTFFKAQLGADEGAQLMSRVFTARDVQIMEKLVGKISASSNFSTSGREPPEPQGGRVSQEVYDKMTGAEKLDYARRFNQTEIQKSRAA